MTDLKKIHNPLHFNTCFICSETGVVDDGTFEVMGAANDNQLEIVSNVNREQKWFVTNFILFKNSINCIKISGLIYYCFQFKFSDNSLGDGRETINDV